MAMLEKHRNALYQHFAPELGEEVTQALMANFPSRDVEEPVTKADLAQAMTASRADLTAAVADVRVEIAALRTELKGELAGLRTELKGDLAGLRTELSTEIAGLRTELKGEVAGLRTELQHALNRQLVLFTTLLSVAVGILLKAG